MSLFQTLNLLKPYKNCDRKGEGKLEAIRKIRAGRAERIFVLGLGAERGA